MKSKYVARFFFLHFLSKHSHQEAQMTHSWTASQHPSPPVTVVVFQDPTDWVQHSNVSGKLASEDNMITPTYDWDEVAVTGPR